MKAGAEQGQQRQPEALFPQAVAPAVCDALQ
jgi:hypothetical protein